MKVSSANIALRNFCDLKIPGSESRAASDVINIVLTSTHSDQTLAQF